MPFVPSRRRPPAPSGQSRVVLAVGRRVFVNAVSDVARPVPLTDDHGVPGQGTLPDGTEVEIVGWRPRGTAGTRYRVCDRCGGSDGWLAAEELRTSPSRPTPPDPIAPPPASDSPGRRFGSAS